MTLSSRIFFDRLLCTQDQINHDSASLLDKASASGAEDPVFDSRLRRGFCGSSHTSDFKIGAPVAILPGDWHCRVSAGTGRPGASTL